MNIYFTDTKLMVCANNLDVRRQTKQANILALIISNVLRTNTRLADYAREHLPFRTRRGEAAWPKPLLRLEDYLYPPAVAVEHSSVEWAGASSLNFYIACSYFIILNNDSYCNNSAKENLRQIILHVVTHLEELISISAHDASYIITEDLLYRNTKEEYKTIESTTKAYQRQLTDLWKDDILGAVKYEKAYAQWRNDPTGAKPRMIKPPSWLRGYHNLEKCPDFAVAELKAYREELLNA